jgi:gliding motility-associated lipoprotein GldD
MPEFRNLNLALALCCSLLLVSCGNEPKPLPRGYFRIDLPEKTYLTSEKIPGLTFEAPSYSRVELLHQNSSDSSWFNLAFPAFNARLHCTYRAISGDFDKLLGDAHNMAYSHEVKARSIEKSRIHRDSAHVHGMVFDLRGEVASPLQFFATDSNRHFLRGSLYFNNRPNPDSIAPVLAYIREDVIHLLNSLEWSMPE